MQNDRTVPAHTFRTRVTPRPYARKPPRGTSDRLSPPRLFGDRQGVTTASAVFRPVHSHFLFSPSRASRFLLLSLFPLPPHWGPRCLPIVSPLRLPILSVICDCALRLPRSSLVHTGSPNLCHSFTAETGYEYYLGLDSCALSAWLADESYPFASCFQVVPFLRLLLLSPLLSAVCADIDSNCVPPFLCPDSGSPRRNRNNNNINNRLRRMNST